MRIPRTAEEIEMRENIKPAYDAGALLDSACHTTSSFIARSHGQCVASSTILSLIWIIAVWYSKAELTRARVWLHLTLP